MGQGSRAREGTEDVAGEAQPLLESDVGVRPEEEEERKLGIPAQRPEPMDGSG